jgi:hypothetical protein
MGELHHIRSMCQVYAAHMQPFLGGGEGRQNVCCIFCHCAVILPSLGTFTTQWYSPDLVNCRSRSLVNLYVKLRVSRQPGQNTKVW